MVGSVSFSACAVWRGNSYLSLMNVFFLQYYLVNLGASNSLFSPSHAPVSTRVVSMIVREIKSLRSLIFEIRASWKTYWSGFLHKPCCIMALLTLILEQWPKLVLKSPTKSSVGRGRNLTPLKMMMMTKTMRPPRDKLGEEQPKMSGVRKCGVTWGWELAGEGGPWLPVWSCRDLWLRCGSFDRFLLSTPRVYLILPPVKKGMFTSPS